MQEEPLQELKRFCKSLRNRFKDPLPRNSALKLKRIVREEKGFKYEFETISKSYFYTVNFPENLLEKINHIPEINLKQILTAIGITFVPSFFKITDFECVEINTADLDQDTCHFFETFLIKGLGEFRYLQGLDPGRRVRVIANIDKEALGPASIRTSDTLLMLNGGGKDTIVAAEILKKTGQEFIWATVNPDDTRRKVIEISENKKSYYVNYSSDKNMHIDYRYAWGHVPFSAICASLGTLIAMATGLRYVASGNEVSANYGNVIYKGQEVNHQYSKTFEFEKGFSDFVKRRVSGDINVFSILRPFHDLQLASLFSNMSDYHSHFISCNREIRRGRWCKECPKCAFTAMALYPFVGPDGIRKIFGEDILQKTSIRKHIFDLVSDGIKPWECVGTLEESRLALSLILERYPELEFDGQKYKKTFEKIIIDFDKEKSYKKIIDSTQEQHIIPPGLVDKINMALPKKLKIKKN